MWRWKSLRLLAAACLVLGAGVACAMTSGAPDAEFSLLAANTPAIAASILNRERDDDFRVAPGGLLYAPPERVAWYRVELARDWNRKTPPLLVLGGDLRARVVVYVPPSYDARVVAPYSANLDPRFSRHALVFELPSDLRAEQPIFLELGKPGQSQPLRASIIDYASYQIGDLRHVRISMFLVGIQIAMLFVIACFWLVLRDRVFAYFVGYVGAQVVYTLAVSGELYALPGATLIEALRFHPGQFAAIVSAALSISFILDFAELPRYVPQLARVLALMRWPYFMFALVVWIPALQPDRWLPNAVNGMLVLSTLAALAASAQAWLRGSRQAGYFLISWLPLLCLTIARVAQLLFSLPLPAWLEYGFPASMAYAAVVITIGLADRTLQARRELDTVTRIADLDPLTGVLNRRAILERLHGLHNDAREANRALGLLFLDLDHFKEINDSHGHLIGDRVLREVASAMQAELRDLDWLGRYGGEEFLAVLPGATERAAHNVAERIRVHVAECRIEHAGVVLHPTISVGIALHDGVTSTVESLIEHADSALYRAKQQGRDRVVHYVPDAEPA